MSFTEFYRVVLGFYWVLLDFTEFYWVVLGFTGFYWVLLGFTVFFWCLNGTLAGPHWVVSGFGGGFDLFPASRRGAS